MNAVTNKIKAGSPAKLKKFKRRKVKWLKLWYKQTRYARKRIKQIFAVLPNMSEEEREVQLHAGLDELSKNFFEPKLLYPVYMSTTPYHHIEEGE